MRNRHVFFCCCLVSLLLLLFFHSYHPMRSSTLSMSTAVRDAVLQMLIASPPHQVIPFSCSDTISYSCHKLCIHLDVGDEVFRVPASVLQPCRDPGSLFSLATISRLPTLTTSDILCHFIDRSLPLHLCFADLSAPVAGTPPTLPSLSST